MLLKLIPEIGSLPSVDRGIIPDIGSPPPVDLGIPPTVVQVLEPSEKQDNKTDAQAHLTAKLKAVEDQLAKLRAQNEFRDKVEKEKEVQEMARLKEMEQKAEEVQEEMKRKEEKEKKKKG